MAKAVEQPITKFTVEYLNSEKEVESRWHYDYNKTRSGPVLVEELMLPKKEKKKVAKNK
jgi:hypothetical protein